MTHYPESISGPRERVLDAPCWICRNHESATLCDDCGFAICKEYTVTCSLCRKGERCLSCAIRRGGVEIDGEQYCEECATAMEPELEEARR